MLILLFIIQLIGATMLLLYAVRMVRTGIERIFGASFKTLLVATSNPISAAASGLLLAIILQSSAAVNLLAAGFSGAKILAFGAGLSMALGADLGSALLIQILSFQLEWLIPLLLAVGGLLFVKTNSKKLKQIGRIILGIAFILISLKFLRETMEPIAGSAFLPSLASYLKQDFITAFIIGATLAFIMHSSVAAILMCVTVVALDVVSLEAGASLVLGANLGSAVIPLWLSRGMSPVAKRVPLANLLLRGSGAIIALFCVNNFQILPLLETGGAGQTLLNLHIAFNFILLGSLPFCAMLEKPITQILPEIEQQADFDSPISRSVLDDSVLENPQLATANLRREVLRMSQIIEGMMLPVMDLYQNFDKTHMISVREQDEFLNSALDGIRHYMASIPNASMKKSERKHAEELIEYAIALESAGDIIAKRLLTLAQQKDQQGIKFSKQGHMELLKQHNQVMINMSLASNVLISEDMESARLLLEEKTEMTRYERSSRKKHLKRLNANSHVSFVSSDFHLETLKALKDFNSLIASVAYPILYRNGQLLETRLINNMSDKS